MTEPVRVRVDGFGFRYAGRTDSAVLDVDLLVEPGERILLTGASGAGKSTLLAGMAGLLGADAGDPIGEILLDGRPAGTARDRIGIVFQDPDSQLVMSRVGDEVAFGLENRGVPAGEIWPRVRRALDSVGFSHRLDHSTHALSGGEKQRLVLAGALVARPGLLLLDEPTSQLDPDGAELVRAAVAHVLADRTTTLVLVDHDAGPWLPLIDRVVEVQPVPSEGRPLPIGSREGRLHSDGSRTSDAAGGVRELARDWRPAVPPIPPHLPSEGRLLPIGSPEGVLHSEAAGFSYPLDPARSREQHGPIRPSLPPTDVVLRTGEICAITGPNGSGKSTLGLLLAGLRAPQVGRIVASAVLAGHLGNRPPHRWRARDLVLRTGTVFQNPEHHFLTGRVRDELSLGPLRAGAGHRNAQQRAEELLVRLGLSAYADANPFTLSGGQQRRLSVAAALATRPSVLVLDEPTFGQDPVTWQELLLLLAEARDDGAALCLISHDQRLVTEFADYRVDLASSATELGGFGQNRHESS